METRAMQTRIGQTSDLRGRPRLSGAASYRAANGHARLLAPLLWVLCAVACLLPSGLAQQAASLQRVHTLYVAPFDAGPDGARLRESLIHSLDKAHRFQIVSTAAAADALLRGTGKIWIRGYVSNSGRTPANSREPVYAGYLSVEVIGAQEQPLWSWLVTPGRLAWKSIVDDLADHAASRLLEAVTGSAAPGSSEGGASPLAHTELAGAGATFPGPLYQEWFEDFEQLHPGVRVQYRRVGSQTGTDELITGKLDFAGADIAPELLTSAPVSSLRRVPSVLGAVVAAYNLNGAVEDLHLTPEALAGIYLGRIRRWNDPEIRRSNKGVDLPDAPIVVVHRSDGSGTTWVWSDYLSKVSPAWSSALSRGATLAWPVGIGADGNDGVADTVQKTSFSIGYVELAYAIRYQLNCAAVRNRSGEFVHADLDTIAAAAGSTDAGNEASADITDAPGRHAYPIATFTWLLVRSEAPDAAKRAALLELLRWILTVGQKECSALGYLPLPRPIAEAQLRLLEQTH